MNVPVGPVNQDFISGFLFHAIARKEITTRDELFAIFYGEFSSYFGDNKVKLETAFARSLCSLFEHYGVTRDNASPPCIQINKNAWKKS